MAAAQMRNMKLPCGNCLAEISGTTLNFTSERRDVSQSKEFRVHPQSSAVCWLKPTAKQGGREQNYLKSNSSRFFDGVIPNCFLYLWPKCEADAKPHCSAISSKIICGFSSNNLLASSKRSFITQFRKVKPYCLFIIADI